MEHESADISVVIPYYNREQYIDEAVQSVLAQTLRPLEIIIVNDGSRESSRRCLDRYADVCTIVDLPVNVGLPAARNEGIRRARGLFIAFLDDDDLWLPEKLEVQRRYMAEHPPCDMVHSAAWSFYSGRPDHLLTRDWPGPLTLAQALTHDFWVMPSTMLVRADAARALGGFDPRFRSSEDHDFTLRCAAAGYRIEGIPEPLTRLRRQDHPSLTRRHWRMFAGHLRLCWKQRALYRRVYGWRGIVSFTLESMRIDSKKVRYVGGAVRLLARVLPAKWKVRPDYQEPVQRAVSPLDLPVVSHTTNGEIS
ncbi:MAG: glycosyltransferase family 2 protein [Bryobacteraceae bacterium]